MSDPQIEKLLIVQDRDVAVQKIEQELERIPQERSALEAHITAEQTNIEAASQALKEKEVARNEIDSEVKAKESAIARFLTQQVEVKKNDEYRALTAQIKQSEKEIAELEERQIELMLEIDTTREAFEAEKATIEARIVEQQQQIVELGEREKNLKTAVKEANVELDAARSAAEENYLGHYDRVKKLCKRPPYVALIEAHKCGGCHLRVSNEVSSGALLSGEPHFCDQCARIVYG
ncbi:zinc ribbon domain-containing protein [Coraliomargarita sp. W4R53]